MTAGQMSVGQMSVVQMSAGQMSVGQMSVGQMSAGKMSVVQMSVGPMSVDKMLFVHPCFEQNVCRPSGILSKVKGTYLDEGNALSTGLHCKTFYGRNLIIYQIS
jgi:hypothetical protein